MKFLFEKSNYHEAPPIIITNPKKDKYKFRNCVCGREYDLYQFLLIDLIKLFKSQFFY